MWVFWSQDFGCCINSFWEGLWCFYLMASIYERLDTNTVISLTVLSLSAFPDLHFLFCFSSQRIPMYGEAKLAFFIYLWYPKTKVSTFTGSCFIFLIIFAYYYLISFYCFAGFIAREQHMFMILSSDQWFQNTRMKLTAICWN